MRGFSLEEPEGKDYTFADEYYEELQNEYMADMLQDMQTDIPVIP